jgi:hypothetical protein
MTASTLSTPEVQRLNSAFAWVCALLAVALPLAVLYQLATTSTEGLLLRAGVHLSVVQVKMLDVSLGQRIVAVMLGVLPVLPAPEVPPSPPARPAGGAFLLQPRPSDSTTKQVIQSERENVARTI